MQTSTSTAKKTKPTQAAAAKVTAYRCPDTGELFPTAQKLAAHRRARTKEANEQARREALKARYAELSDRPRLEATSLSEVCQLMMETLPEMLTIGKKLGRQHYDRKPKLLNVWFNGMTLGLARMNEENYNRPLDKLDNPSQMRLRGDIHLLFEKDPGFFFSANLSSYFPFIHTGCGGASSVPSGYKCHYDLTLCLDDFPKLRAQHEEQRRQLALSKEREAQVERTAAELFATNPEKASADARVAETRAAVEKAQQDFRKAHEAVQALQAEAKSAAELQHPFDYDNLKRLGDFLA